LGGFQSCEFGYGGLAFRAWDGSIDREKGETYMLFRFEWLRFEPPGDMHISIWVLQEEHNAYKFWLIEDGGMVKILLGDG
jgi:hypothetical protein